MAQDRLDDIEDYLALYGIKEFTPYVLDDNILNTVHEIIRLDVPPFLGHNIPYVSRDDVRKRAIDFYNSKVSVHDVGHMSDEMLIDLIRNNMIANVDQLVDLYNSSGAIISPFDIPIEYTHPNAFHGTLELQLVVTQDRTFFRELLPRLKILFNKIILAKKPTTISVTSYIHEIMHSQLESHKGIVKNYYDGEVLSVFFELLYAYENKSNYHLLLAFRINEIFNHFNNMYLFQTGEPGDLPEKYEFYDFCSSGKYLLSDLKAFSLLDKYLNGSWVEKRNILIRLQCVLDGLISTSNFLEDYDIDYESILDSDITKRLLNK